MGLFQNATETYDNNLDFVGKYVAGKEPLAPVGHVITSADLEITIDADGTFCTVASRPKDAGKVIIPVTEDSASRSSTMVAPHPLCDQLKYISAYDRSSTAKQDKYLAQLEDWMQSEFSVPKLSAIYRYVSNGTILRDLTEKGIPTKDKTMVIWRVLGEGAEPRVWCDLDLMRSYEHYYLSKRGRSGKKDVCMVTGEYLPITEKHAKGVFSLNGNAKLISSNDSTNFTYRGRFIDAEQALSVSYTASQKAHNALKWIIANEGTVNGNREFVCWSPQGDAVPNPQLPLLESMMGKSLLEQQPKTHLQYKDMLGKVLKGYRSGLKDHLRSNTVIVTFDAATAGRLAVTFYSEFATEQFLEKLRDWDESCIWYEKDRVFSPSLYSIVKCTYGVERDRSNFGKLVPDEKIIKDAMQRLLLCRIGEEKYPADMERKVVENASALYLYGKYSRVELLQTACAVIKKYHHDRGRELDMELNQSMKDRSYQFGRLLAIFEKMERDTYQSNENREPNAMRLQSVYCNRPMHYAYELEKQLERAYIPRLAPGARIYYKNLIENVLAEIHEFPEKEWNRPLEDTYLMGYYLQRKALYAKKTSAEAVDGQTEKEEETK